MDFKKTCLLTVRKVLFLSVIDTILIVSPLVIEMFVFFCNLILLVFVISYPKKKRAIYRAALISVHNNIHYNSAVSFGTIQV